MTATATASSISPIDRRDLINEILKLPEKELWSIVELRLNLPPSSSSSSRQLHGNGNEHEDIEYWTENALVEELFLQLACTKKTAVARNRLSRKYVVVTDYKYYQQALKLRRWIPIARPPPEFVVNLSDLSSRVIVELKVLQNTQDVLKQAVGRIFENIDEQQYHLSIASQLKVRLEK